MLLVSIAMILFPFAFLDKGISNSSKKIILFFMFAIFIIMNGIRWKTGTDWYPYFYGFDNATSYYDAVLSPYAFEWGFGLLNYLVRSFSSSYTVFLFLFALLTIYTKYKVIINERFIEFGLLSTFFYYCYSIGDIVATRQALAISLTLFSILYIIEKNKLNFLLFVLLATLIHRSAIIFIFAYFLYHLDMEKKTLLYIFLTGLLLNFGLSRFQVTDMGIPFIDTLTFLSSYQEKIDTYLNVDDDTSSFGQLNPYLITFLGYLKKMIVIFPMLYLRGDKNLVHSRLVNIVIFGTFIYFVLSSISPDFKRLNGYFEIVEILVLPYLLYSISKKSTRYILILFFCILAVIRLYTAVYSHWDLLDPFYTIFDFHINRVNY